MKWFKKCPNRLEMGEVTEEDGTLNRFKHVCESAMKKYGITIPVRKSAPVTQKQPEWTEYRWRWDQ